MMIVALNKEESFIWSTNEEIDHRSQKYNCPACRKQVLFRQGPHLIPHFAHKKNQACHYTSEPESMKHLSGKIQLYRKLKELVENVELEKYISQIQQKTDIYFEYNHKKFAIEFQCSQISLEKFGKRTKGYLSIGITPIWVFHTDFIRFKGVYELQVPKLVQSGLGLNLQIYLYDVTKRNLVILSQVTPFSKCTSFTNKTTIALKNITIKHLIRQQLLPRKYLSKYREKRYCHLFYSIRFEGLRVPFYQKLYESGFSTFTLPSFVGVPLKYGVAIRTPVIEWQGLLFLELIKVKVISHAEMNVIFKRMIERKWIETVTIYEDLKAPERALREYIDFLKGIGFLNGNSSIYHMNLNSIQKIKEEDVYKYITRTDRLIK